MAGTPLPSAGFSPSLWLLCWSSLQLKLLAELFHTLLQFFAMSVNHLLHIETLFSLFTSGYDLLLCDRRHLISQLQLSLTNLLSLLVILGELCSVIPLDCY